MKLVDLVESATSLPQSVIAVAQAADEDVLKAVTKANAKGLAEFILIGDGAKIATIIEELDGRTDQFTILHETDPQKACHIAVQQVADGHADAIMKGLVSTAEILRAVLDKERGLRTAKLISHVAVFEVPGYDRLLLLTDAAMNISPELKEKVEIIENAVQVAHAIGIEQPKVAPICAVEVVNPNMPCTLDAAALSLMNQRNQIKGCLIDGPLALDNAVSHTAAEHKGISSAVAGQSDILMVPNIEVGNALYKSLVYFAQAKVGAIVLGAKAPVILTSRADSDEAKLYSIAVAAHYAAYQNQ